MNNLGLRGFVSFVVWCQFGTWYGHQVLYKNNKKDYLCTYECTTNGRGLSSQSTSFTIPCTLLCSANSKGQNFDFNWTIYTFVIVDTYIEVHRSSWSTLFSVRQEC